MGVGIITSAEESIDSPVRITSEHHVADFDSDAPELDHWLKKRALKNQIEGATQTYVVCAEGKVIGFYSLAAGVITHEDAIGRVRRNMPDPVPAMLLGRLAVHKNYQKRGIGPGLLKDAVLRTAQAADIAGIRAIYVNARDEKAASFYRYFGFVPSPGDPLLLMVKLTDIKATVGL